MPFSYYPLLRNEGGVQHRRLPSAVHERPETQITPALLRSIGAAALLHTGKRLIRAALSLRSCPRYPKDELQDELGRAFR
jgi:hypothetical protein